METISSCRIQSRGNTSRPSRETRHVKSEDQTTRANSAAAGNQDLAAEQSPKTSHHDGVAHDPKPLKTRDSTASLRKVSEPSQSRASAFLGWPLLSRKNSARRSNQRKLRPSPLSAIIESPRGLHGIPTLSPKADPRQDSESYLMSDVQPGTAISTDNVSSISLHSSQHSLPASLKFDVAPSLSLKPEPLFSRASTLNPTPELPEVDEVAKPVPAILCSNHDDPFSSKRQLSPSRSRLSRSASTGSVFVGRAPVQHLPPLPSIAPKISRPGLMRSGSSQDTLSSTGTSCSSILNSVTASPQMKAMADFSQRHPEMGLGAHIKRNESELKSSLMPVQSGQPRQSSPVRYLQSFHGSFRKVTSTNGSVDGQAQLRNSSQPRDKLEAPATAGKDEHVNDNQDIERGHDQDRQTTPGSKVSANGSPAERQKTSLSRDTSENSMMSHYDQALPEIQTPLTLDDSRNPFQWEQNSIEGSSRPTSLKGSPNSKRRHRRQNCMRISVETKPAGPPSRTTSSTNMFDIKEEPLDGPEDPNRHRNAKEDSTKRQDFFEFKGNDTQGWNTDRASFAPSSPTLSMSHLYFDNEQGIGRSRRRKSSISPNARRTSGVSSTVTISDFPSPGKSAPQHGRVFGNRTESGGNLKEELKGEREALRLNPQQLYLPQDSEEFEYPTIDLNASPPRTSEEDNGTYATTTDNVTLPYRSHDPERRASSSPRRLSPPLKSAPTTELSSDIPSLSIRRTPLSSSIEPTNASAANPLTNKPTLAPPTKPVLESRGRPNGPREAPAQGIMKTAMQLRRDHSEARTSIDSNDSYISRRCFHVGKEPPVGNGPDRELMAHIERLDLNKEHLADRGSEKENGTHEVQRDDRIWNNHIDFWREENAKGRGRGLVQNSRKLRTPSPRRLPLGSAKSVKSGDYSVAGSLYDSDGFLKP
ncbi:MAG: hypothetical protein M1831_002432 [Alyxoria varia]|nr:MAG: hypothetical protein M1831_002432 [Alyxoria varia]